MRLIASENNSIGSLTAMSTAFISHQGWAPVSDQIDLTRNHFCVASRQDSVSCDLDSTAPAQRTRSTALLLETVSDIDGGKPARLADKNQWASEKFAVRSAKTAHPSHLLSISAPPHLPVSDQYHTISCL